MRRLIAIVVLSISLASRIVFCATGIVEGVITDAAGSPVRGASVHFDRLDKNNSYSIRTDKHGRFAHYGLAPGRYRIAAFAPDGQPIEQREAVVSAESIVRMDFVSAQFSNGQSVPTERAQPVRAQADTQDRPIAVGQSDSNAQIGPHYATPQRIQLSEPCPLIAKWLSQGIAPGAHWQMPRYEPDLGILTFKVISSESLTKAEIRQFVDGADHARPVLVDQLVLTLRSLVASALSFDNAPHSTADAADSCAIAAAFKFTGKNGTALQSSGKMEIELLKTIKDRYAEHGLDY